MHFPPAHVDAIIYEEISTNDGEHHNAFGNAFDKGSSFYICIIFLSISLCYQILSRATIQLPSRIQRQIINSIRTMAFRMSRGNSFSFSFINPSFEYVLKSNQKHLSI